MRRTSKVLILAALLVLGTSGQAGAHELGPLSESKAEALAVAYAEREGHRIFHMEDLSATVLCGRLGRYEATCAMTLGLRFTLAPGVEPTHVNGRVLVRKIGVGRFRYRLEQEWEVLPAGDSGLEEWPSEAERASEESSPL